MRGPKVRRVVVLAALLGLGLALAAPAGAATTRPPEIRFVAPVVPVSPALPDVAFVTASYRCFGGQPAHLWVSVKQGGPDPTAPESGATVTSWYDTNVLTPAPVKCNGQWQAVSVPVGKYPHKARLTSGPAWVQFCLTIPGPGPFGIVVAYNTWARVVGV